jgi:hypothetical protein
MLGMWTTWSSAASIAAMREKLEFEIASTRARCIAMKSGMNPSSGSASSRAGAISGA